MDRYLEFILNHYILSLALAVVTYLLIQEFFDTAFKKFKYISPLLAVAKMNDGEAVVIDVREPNEITQGHIENAINTPLSKLPEHLSKLAPHKGKPVLIACQTGARAASAGKILSKAGFEQVFVITGGMQSWEGDYKLPIKIPGKNKAAA
ncbi:rhodanese-like domain-containing protein [Methylobacter sp. BlB1]|jgi:rhodanese-related sulfurtransferase|uniref:rhodanese-like domain-containing protein n=1 Tax=unclassified Methylobacter TaxID=2635283 RepID=UPI001893C2B9|nr:rhodanese-like domain-containing protein [Methylobacter sp. BlB1]MBF6647146.1 rhodanese-like domain-containing protein [Methylobacter sp. BlB1]